MIFGIGCDLVQIPRIEELYSLHRERFLQRLLSKRELTNLPDGKFLVPHLAKRFAAKEAFSKASGLGLGKNFTLNQIEILKDERGKPYFSHESLALLPFPCEAHLSLSDDYPIALAYVILYKQI